MSALPESRYKVDAADLSARITRSIPLFTSILTSPVSFFSLEMSVCDYIIDNRVKQAIVYMSLHPLLGLKHKNPCIMRVLVIYSLPLTSFLLGASTPGQ